VYLSVDYLDVEMHLRHRDFDGMTARIVQHEIDHLDGVLFIDMLDNFERERVLKRLRFTELDDILDKTGQ
jgi:peptide deformylase